jgi:membrane protease YdiL (CAAX protease family)
VIVASIGFILVVQSGRTWLTRHDEAAAAPAATPGTDAGAKAAAGLFQLAAKAVVGAPSKLEREQGADFLPMLAQSDDDELRLAVVVAEVEGREAAIRRLEGLSSHLSADDPLAADAAIIRRLLENPQAAAAPSEVQSLIEHHGWFARLAFSQGKDDRDVLRAGVLGEARKVAQAMRYVNFGLIGALVGALLLFSAAVWVIATGRIRLRFAAPAPGGSVLLETFAVFLAGFILVQVAMHFLQPWLGDEAGLLRWSLVLVPLWPLVRGMDRTAWHFAIGWHRGYGVIREIGAGILGYLSCLPIVAIGVTATLVLMRVSAGLEPGGEGPGKLPTHPLGDMLSKATLWEKIQLVMLAVVWAPVVEESVFRGALFHHLRGRLPMIVAGLVTAVIFAAIHPQGWVAIPALASIGLVLSLLREWRGTLLAPMAAHAVNNGVIVGVLLFALSR